MQFYQLSLQRLNAGRMQWRSDLDVMEAQEEQKEESGV